MAQSAPALIDVDKIDIEEGFNARTHMDEDGLERLAESLAESGVVQSIAVRPTGNGRYSVVAGHRRVTAARMGGVEQVPVLIREETRAEAIRDSLIENSTRRRSTTSTRLGASKPSPRSGTSPPTRRSPRNST
jgi:ParB family chromosome partitioning protein